MTAQQSEQSLPPGMEETVQAAIKSLEQGRSRGGRSAGAKLRGDASQWFGADAYPPDAIRAGQQGRTVAKLSIGSDGRVTACAISGSSGSASLDAKTCEIAMANVTFTAATDRRGKPITSSYTFPVRWVLPTDTLPRTSFDEVVLLDVGADDRLIGCTSSIAGKLTGGSDPACARFGTLPPTALHGLKGALGDRHVIVTFLHVIQFAADPLIVEAHSASGQTVVALKRVALDVLADGTMANSMVVEQTGAGDPPPDPSEGLGRFAVAGRTDKLQVMTAISYAAAP